MATLTVAEFRLQYPRVFGCVETYPDPMVQLYVDLCVGMVNAERWGEQTNFGVGLLVAHFLALEARDAQTSAIGGTPGVGGGLVKSKSVDGVSVSYAVEAMAMPDGGPLNETRFGRQWLWLARMMGAGPVQVGLPGPADAAAAQLGGQSFTSMPWTPY